MILIIFRLALGSDCFIDGMFPSVPVPLDPSTPTGMSCIRTYGENCKSDNVSKYRDLLVAFLLLWHENCCHGKIQ